MSKMKFILNGCDISFVAEAPADITLEQLLKQTDKIIPNWCACGICSLARNGYSPNQEVDTDIFIDYDSIRKSDSAPCIIKDDKGLKSYD